MTAPLRFVLLLTLLLAGCASSVDTRMMHFLVEPRANQDAPVALDMVAIKNLGLLQKLSRLSAAEWFARRQELQQDYPFHLQVWRWELVPGSTPEPFELPDEARESEGILIFAHYGHPGLHRARVGPHEELLIHLTEKELRLIPVRQGSN